MHKLEDWLLSMRCGVVDVSCARDGGFRRLGRREVRRLVMSRSISAFLAGFGVGWYDIALRSGTGHGMDDEVVKGQVGS